MSISICKKYFREQDIIKDMQDIGVDINGINIMVPKAENYTIKMDKIRFNIANILKQEMLSQGGDAALSKDIASGKAIYTDLLLIGSYRTFLRVIEKLRSQMMGLDKIAIELESLIKNYRINNFPLKVGSKTFELGRKTLVMGILNVTPDSFYDGGNYIELDNAIKQVEKMVIDGADIIDIGAESTRPYSTPIEPEAEINRLLPVLKEVVKRFHIPISIDTYRATTAKAALEEGANMINDIGGLKFDNKMAHILASYNVPVVIMHSKAPPKVMNEHSDYTSLIPEIIEYLKDSIEKGVVEGIKTENIIIDPGIGFGKKTPDNVNIIKGLDQFKGLGRPILIGVSRKRFIGDILSLPSPKERLEGTLASIVLSILRGAHIVRVHDVKEVKKVVDLADYFLYN